MARQYVGFEIGDRTVSMTLCVGGAVRKAAVLELPDDLVSGGEILSMDAMADLIRAAAKDNGIPRTNASIILPSSLVYVRNITLPGMTDQQFRYSLPYEFKDYLTDDKGKYIFDYAITDTRTVTFEEAAEDLSGEANPDLPKQGGETETVCEMDVLACCTLKSTIENYRNMLRRAGFKLRIAVPEEYALASGICEKLGRDNGQCCCVTLLGYRETSMFFYIGSRYAFKRVIGLGLYDLEEKVAELKDIDIQIAHSQVINNFENILDNDELGDIYADLSIEVMKAINFFNYNNRDKELTVAYIGGGGLSAEHYRRAIASIVTPEVRLADDLLPDGTQVDKAWTQLLAYCSTLEGGKGGKA